MDDSRSSAPGSPSLRHRRAAAETSQTLDRGLAVLELLAQRDHASGMTITELAQALGVGRPVVYRLVATLEGRGLASRREDGRVRLGLGITRLAQGIAPLLREAAMPTLRMLADGVSATAHLTVAESGEALAVAVVEPSRTDIHVAYRVGSRHPLHVGAAGRAILEARSGTSGLVTSDGELQPGAHGLAAPILGVPGLEASVGVVSLAVLDVDRAGPKVVAASKAISRALR